MLLVMTIISMQAAMATGYGLPSKIQQGVILHCFNWKYSDITANLNNIAAAGFTAVQTSPAQSNYNGQTAWHTLYRPRDTQIGPNSLGTEADLATLCAEAHKLGIKVIVDVVANHTDGALDWVADFWKNTDLYHTLGAVSNWNDRYQVTHGEIGMKDLKTEDSRVQDKFKTYIQALKAIGVDGCRFDAAKHIGLPSEGDNFWPAVIDTTMYNYGEILDNTGGNDATLLPEYLKYISITDSPYGTNNLLGSAKNGQATSFGGGNYAFSYNTTRLVYWGESHDTYCNSGGMSDGVSQEVVDRAYAIAASHNNIPALYFSRPTSSTGPAAQAGVIGSTHFTSASVAEVNKFHNAMDGKPDYYTASGSVASSTRKNGGAIVVNFAGSGYVTIANGGGYATPGTYTDRVSGNTFTVTSSTISGTTNSTGIAVLYNDAVATPSVSLSQAGGIFKTETLSLTATLNNATSGWYQVGAGAKTTFTSTATLTIGTGVAYGNSIIVKWGATGSDGVEYTGSATFSKVDPNAKVYVYYNNPNNWSQVNCYLYASASVNNAWPGASMTYDASLSINGQTGWWYMEVPSTYVSGYAMMTDGQPSGTRQYPGTGQPGIAIEGSSLYIDGTSTGHTTVVPGAAVVVPTVSINKASTTFSGSIDVTMTASTTSATIVYTTDGTAPTTSSTQATGIKTLTLSATTTLTAGVLYNGRVQNVVSATYTLQPSTPATAVTVYVKADVAPYLYAWDNNKTALLGAWPGTKMSNQKTFNGVAYYYQTFTKSPVNIIFNNGSGAQTADITGLTSSAFYSYDGTAGYGVLTVDTTTTNPAVTSQTITMNTAVATYCSSYDLDFTNVSGLEAYIASGYRIIGGQPTFVFTRVTYVPAGTGLFLTGTAGTAYTVPVNTIEAGYRNFLVGVTANTTINVTDGTNSNLVLVPSDTGYQFATIAAPRTIAAGKAYMQLPTSVVTAAGTKLFNFILEDQTTGISQLSKSASADDDAYYTLTGTKTYHPVPGLYIHRGKKIVIR